MSRILDHQRVKPRPALRLVEHRPLELPSPTLEQRAASATLLGLFGFMVLFVTFLAGYTVAFLTMR